MAPRQSGAIKPGRWARAWQRQRIRAEATNSGNLLECLAPAFLHRLDGFRGHFLRDRGEFLRLTGERLELLAGMGGRRSTISDSDFTVRSGGEVERGVGIRAPPRSAWT
jgi:hypothetical protein